LVNVGGDLYALGVSDDGDPWEIGIRSSDDRDRITHTVRVQDRAIATSGDYEQFFEHRGRRYHHLLDPVTGAPRRSRLHSVTVSADTCMTADVAGTAVFGCHGLWLPRRSRSGARNRHGEGRGDRPHWVDESALFRKPSDRLRPRLPM
jgi:thiamine biosynthesis lipoprotein